MNFQIRLFREEDLSRAVEIEKLSFPSPWSEKLLREELERDLARFFAAVWDGELAGYILWWAAPEEAHLINLAVHPKFRRKGVARALLRHLEKTAAAEGARRVTLEVRENNAAAIHLYESEGFQLIAIRRKYYSDDDSDAWIYWKEFDVL